MFLMLSKITVGTLQPFVCTSIKWKHSIDDFSDSATVEVPAIAFLKKAGNNYDYTQLPFKEGDKIKIECGYNGRLYVRFAGFIKRINYSSPLELECEGYSYPLQKIIINKTYLNTSVKAILTDILKGTGISISPATVNLPLPEAVFKNVTAVQILEWFKKKCLLTVYFNGNQIYAGLRAIKPAGSVNFNIGWNIVKADDLLFSGYKEFSTVRLKGVFRKKDGTVQMVETNGNGDVKTIHLDIDISKANQQMLINDQKLIYDNRGYTGKITTFLEPYADAGMSAVITDPLYPARTGTYFVTSVEGSFNKNGARQVVGIGYKLSE